MFRWTLNDLDSNVIEVLRKDGRLSDPKGYEGLVLTHERDERYHGISYDFTTELGFFCKGGGKELIDAAYELKSQEANVRIKLEVKCNGEYVTMLDGKLNFASYRQEWVAGVLYTFMDAEKDDIKIKLANREDMEVDLLTATSLDGVALNSYPYLGYGITMHSKVIKLTSEWENTLNTIACNTFTTASFDLFHIAEFTKVKGELKESNDITPSFESFSVFDTTFNPLVEFDNSYVFPFNVTISYNVAGWFYDRSYASGTIDLGDCDGGTPSGISRSTTLQNNPNTASSQGWILLLKVGQNFNDATGWILATVPDYAELTSVHTDSFSGVGSVTVSVNRGDKVWLMWSAAYSLASAADLSFDFQYSVCDISITADTTTPESVATGIAIHEAWSRLCERITDQPLSFYSEFFGRTDSNISYASDGCGSKLAITSGKNIRGFSGEPIKPSLKSMFNSCNAVYGIGIGIEKYQGVDIVRCEEIDYFYQTTEMLRLTYVPNIQMRHVGERVFNEIKLGFQKWQIESDGGLDEPLSKINYVIPNIKNNKNKFEALSEFVAGMYAIEWTRRKNSIDFATEDTSYDEDIFFLCLNNADLTVCEKDEKFNSISGLISPETAYNLRFLLSMTFDRLKNQFVSGLTKLGTLANPVVMPAEGEGNEGVTYQYVDGCAGDGFGSNQRNGRAGRYPHAFARRDNPIWLPEEYTFDYPLDFDKYLTLVSNPYELILFSENDTNFKSGWLLNLEYNVRNKSGTFTILRNSGFAQ